MTHITLERFAQLRATQTGQACPRTSTRRLHVAATPMILTAVKLAGEDDSMHAVMLGVAGDEPELFWVADPRQRARQHVLYSTVARRLLAYMRTCRLNEEVAQLWVTSPAALGLLRSIALSTTWRYRQPDVQRFAHALGYFLSRSRVDGQQAMVCATSAIISHVAAPIPAADQHHLGALIAALDHAGRPTLLDAVEEAESHPMGSATSPEWDNAILAPLVTDYHAATTTSARDRAEAQIGGALQPVLRHMFDHVERAIQIITALPHPALPGLEHVVNVERGDLAYWLDNDFRFSCDENTRATTHAATRGECSRRAWQRSLITGDRFSRAAHELEGDILFGAVSQLIHTRQGRANHYTAVVETDQRSLSARVGDTLTNVDATWQSWRVDALERCGDLTRVTLALQAGKRHADELPERGDVVNLASLGARWCDLLREAARVARRVRQLTWTHDDSNTPTTSSASAPANLLAIVEQLR